MEETEEESPYEYRVTGHWIQEYSPITNSSWVDLSASTEIEDLKLQEV